MGRRKGSKNKIKVDIVEQENNQPVKAEEKKESYIERYNRPLPFIARPFCFGAGITPKE